MTEKRVKKQSETTPALKVAPEETVETVVTNSDAEIPSDTEVLANSGEITEVRDDETGEVVEVPRELTERQAYISELADEVEQGLHGSGRERMIVLGADYAEVQQELTRRYRDSRR